MTEMSTPPAEAAKDQSKGMAIQAGDAASQAAPVHELREVKYIQNIGRFENGQSVADATFGPCTLVFGENGWGKSTLADLLRSLTMNNPDIVIGRKTLAGGPEQKAVVRVGDQQAVFENGAWSGISPRIAVYDSVFVNENVFSGDVVTNDHLTKQYGMVVGEEGLRRVRRIVELDNENRANNSQSRVVEAELDGIVKAVGPEGMARKEFLAVGTIPDVDAKIEAKEKEVQRASRAKELKGAGEPRVLSVPAETEELRKSLHSTIEGIAEAAARAVREHIAKHEEKGRGSAMTHESWLEAGTTFVDEVECAFCGQPLDDRTLVDSYAEFFSDAYKAQAADVKAKRTTFARYENGEYRDRAEEIVRQNETLYAYWKEAGQIEPPEVEGGEATIERMEAAARLLDAVFVEKQGNLTDATTGKDVEAAITAWDEGRKEVLRLNGVVEIHVAKIKGLKESVDETELPHLEKELKTLRATKRRHEAATVAVTRTLEGHEVTKKRIAKEKADEKSGEGRSKDFAKPRVFCASHPISLGPQFSEQELALLEGRLVACDLSCAFPLGECDRAARHMLQANIGRVLGNISGTDRAPRRVRDIRKVPLFPAIRLALFVEGVREQVPEVGREVGGAAFGLGAGRAEIDKPVLEDRPRHRL